MDYIFFFFLGFLFEDPCSRPLVGRAGWWYGTFLDLIVVLGTDGEYYYDVDFFENQINSRAFRLVIMSKTETETGTSSITLPNNYFPPLNILL